MYRINSFFAYIFHRENKPRKKSFNPMKSMIFCSGWIWFLFLEFKFFILYVLLTFQWNKITCSVVHFPSIKNQINNGGLSVLNDISVRRHIKNNVTPMLSNSPTHTFYLFILCNYISYTKIEFSFITLFMNKTALWIVRYTNYQVYLLESLINIIFFTKKIYMNFTHLIYFYTND